jgi:hypothetical protein
LEDEHRGAIETARLGEIACGAEQHRGVPVVPAAVETIRDRRAIGQVRGLIHGQRIHVGAKSDPPRALAASFEESDDAGLARPLMDLDAPGAELLGHESTGADLLEADLRMGMEMAADRREVGGKAVDQIEGRHAGNVSGGFQERIGAAGAPANKADLGGLCKVPASARRRHPRGGVAP